MLHQQIKDSIPNAMKNKDTVKLNVLRGLLTSFMNELVATNRTPQEILKDEEALIVIARIAKQRRDSIDQYTKAERIDLANEDQSELDILKTYLPEMMDKGEVERIVREKKQSMGIVDISKKGMLMAEVMKELKGKAEGSMVKEIVDKLFNS